MRGKFIILLLLLCSLNVAAQTPNYLDPSFGDTGTVAMPFDKIIWGQGDNIMSVASYANNKIITGWSKFGIIRFNENGSVDSSFAVNGRVKGDYEQDLVGITKIFLLQDQKILTTGIRFSAARLLPNGDADSSFNKVGRITASQLTTGECRAAAMQQDGKVVLCGEDYDWARVVRINADGTMDSSFSGHGIFSKKYGVFGCGIRNIQIRPNGKILICGDINNSKLQFLVIQLNPDGFLDSSFGNNGEVMTDLNGVGGIAHDLAIQPDGKVILAGRSVFAGGLMIRLNIDGSVDSSFGSNGIVVTSMPNGDIAPEEIELDGNGNIYLGGHINKGNIDDDFYLLRYTPDGSVDTNFARLGIETKFGEDIDRVYDMKFQLDGKILLGGYTDYDRQNGISIGAMVRYLPFPVSVKDFDNRLQTIQLYPNPANSTITVKDLPTDKGDYFITDISGKQLLSDHKLLTIDQITIDVAELPSGIYTFHFLSENIHLTKMFAKS